MLRWGESGRGLLAMLGSIPLDVAPNGEDASA
jgi:hypothetical protein